MTPDKYTIQESFVEVGNGHELYVHEWGNKNTKTPIMYLHGGPGSGNGDGSKQFFDPTRQRVIFFHQRGSGRSVPVGSLEYNTTQDMAQDITVILDKLKVKQCILMGGSWGCALALAYALHSPQRVQAMVLRGIFTGSQQEIDWVDQGRFKAFFPDAWQTYLEATPKSHRNNPTAYHFNRILNGTTAQQKASGYAYENLEGAVLSLDDRFTPTAFEEFDPAGIRVEAHYLANRCFMPDRHIFKNAHKLTMPIYLVQGRYDAVCPPEAAYELHQALPNSELIWTISGHSLERETWNIVRILLLELTK